MYALEVKFHGSCLLYIILEVGVGKSTLNSIVYVCSYVHNTVIAKSSSECMGIWWPRMLTITTS